MKIFIIVIFLFLDLRAEHSTTCIDKLNKLNKLKSQKVSAVENVVAYMFSGNMLTFSKNKDEGKLAQKIRILEIEVKSCRDKNVK